MKAEIQLTYAQILATQRAIWAVLQVDVGDEIGVKPLVAANKALDSARKTLLCTQCHKRAAEYREGHCDPCNASRAKTGRFPRRQ